LATPDEKRSGYCLILLIEAFIVLLETLFAIKAGWRFRVRINWGTGDATGGHMKPSHKVLFAAASVAAVSWTPAYAIEAFVNPQSKPGVLIGSSAGVPPPGIYMFDQVFTYQANLVGPGVKTALGGNTKVGDQFAVDVQGFLFVPGWTFLGATYDALIVQPFVMGSLGSPFNIQESGVHNTYIVPVELSWMLGTSGFGVKTGLGIYVPDGTQHQFIPGVTGSALGAGGTGYPFVGDPYWTFQPELIVSYLKDGWNLSAALYDEINTRNTATQYKTGNIFHADFTATKTIGNWTVGPVAYYFGQVSDDSCLALTCGYATGTLLNPQRFDIWAVGGLLGYNFGPAALSVWATQEVSAKASNPAATAAAVAAFGLTGDASLTHQGMTVFATLSYRLWGPEAPAKPMIHK
jgi:hypothetical protein